jgi:spermidine/putrescine transport system substrate-binding protein
VAVVGSQMIPRLVEEQLLADIDKVQIPNFRNIDPAFRDLVYDPDSQHSVPYRWGTTILLVRNDLAEAPVARWADLWDEKFSGKLALREQSTDLISISLLSLGYRLNSEDPHQLEEARLHLEELDPMRGFLDADSTLAVQTFLNSPAVIMVARQEDAVLALDLSDRVSYVFPQEGSILWVENYVISSRSSNLEAAHAFINFMLGAQVSASIVNEIHYPSANAAAATFIDADTRDNPIIFPSWKDITRSQWTMPLSEEGQLLYQETWQRLLEKTEW